MSFKVQCLRSTPWSAPSFIPPLEARTSRADTGVTQSARRAAADGGARSARKPHPAHRATSAAIWLRVLPPILGFALLVADLGAGGAAKQHRLPVAGRDLASRRVSVFSDPFYSKGPNDQGIGWNVLLVAAARRHRLRPGGAGRHPARLRDRPLRVPRAHGRRRSSACCGRCRRWPGCRSACWCSRAPTRRRSGPSSSARIWPMIINTAVGVQRVPQDYLNVARVLNLSEWKVFTQDPVPRGAALHADRRAPRRSASPGW